MSRYFSLMLCAPAVVLMACSFESKPDDAFLDSSMILRSGVDDAGVTVRKYVDMLESRSQTDGTPVKVTRWERTDAGYTLYLKFSVPVELPFIWSKQEKLSLLQYAKVDGERIPAMQFFMIGMRAPIHPSKAGKVETARPTSPASSPTPTSSATVTPASTAGTATSGAPSASQAEMDAESEGVPSDPAPAATPAPTLQTKPQAHAAPAATSQATAVPTLCSPDETPVFACSTGEKRASLCISNGESQLTYRIAPLGGAPEMVYPANTASTAFKPGTHTSANGQTLPFMSFDKGNYRYVVYGTTTTMQGILVEQNGKRIANLNCQEDRLSEMSTAWFQRLYLGLDRDKHPLQLP
jgi:hypothetical protein